MRTMILLLQLCQILFLSCQYDKKNQKEVTAVNDSLVRNESKKSESTELDQNNFLLDSFSKTLNEPRIEIKTIDKYLDSTSQYIAKNGKKCDNWSLTSDDIYEILTISERVDSRELHYYYDVFPCYYTGKLLFNNRHALYKVNAGAFSIIEFKDTSLIYGYKKDNYKKYFLLGAGID